MDVRARYGEERGGTVNMAAAQSCPYCGEQRPAIDTMNYSAGKPAKYRVQCPGCGVSTGWYDQEEQAWKVWNIRGTPRKTCAVINEHLFLYEGAVYTCGSLKEIFFRREHGTARRIGKAVWLAAYDACVRAAGGIR